ncbi:copper amine oxidase N-terminal domain-containing protein [Paenibacillus wulumuqiensis]|uniref:copper amine oxidase N-terminal domain-containing protein n=1 Tax=Paenibacillus wulumuqiensis TaxID=1567107 RepID=UPI000619BE72|nr:copper amine oxidase N-terminal domain-containing protein [Paenibacillus wulumuqiensis]
MKMYKIILSLFLLIVFCFPKESSAQAATKATSPPILKINQYYILFTYPTSPYVDKNNRLLVPLRSLSDLLGAEVSYNGSSKTANIKLNGHNLMVTTNSKDVVIDQVAKQMDTIPVQKMNSLFVPLKVLLEYLDVKGNYNADSKLIELNDPHYMKSTKQLTQETQDRANLDENQTAFTITSYKVDISSSDPKNNIWRGSLTYTAKNVTDHTIEQGKEDVHSVYMLANGNSQAELYNYKRENHQAVKSGGSITKKRKLIGNANLSYIIVKPYAVN